MRSSGNNGTGMPRGARFIFGIFMILFYIAVGLLCIFDVFNIGNQAISATVGGILCAYGIWRGVRLFLGSN